ncbi:cupin domain-containing protein [Candidatus Uhrbacteria bacterium]|nr:cupin domain-containing protein [Candidatus Uhrbacteria bacterium]
MLANVEKASLLKNDERGSTHVFSARESGYFIVLNRKKGTVSGNHYHKGAMKSKSPEIFYLVSGRAELTIRDMKTKEEEVIDIEEGMKVEIPANVYHAVKARTDIILMEFITSKEDFQKYESDTVKL